MALQTPKQRGTGLQRPSFGTSSTSPSFRASTTEVNRKASLRALTGQGNAPTTPANRMDGTELEVGDEVNVPGEMYGLVKFVGTVNGKNGRFVGVELDRQFAAKGKNDGDVEGIHYFRTSVPGAGIFLPIHRAERRFSPSASDSFPGTPTTPSYSTYNGSKTKGLNGYTPPTPAVPHKFSQSVGPGARPSSPSFKPKRPSLPRPESPLRKQPTLAPTPARQFSQSVRGGRPPLSQTPSKSTLRSSTTSSRAQAGTAQSARPYSRTGSRLGNRGDAIDEESRTPTGNGRTTGGGSVPSFSQPLRTPSRLGSAGGQDAEIQRLKSQLAERDQRLNEQAASLAEMENSVKELSVLIPAEGMSPRPGSMGEDDDRNAGQLRQMLREKNERISKLTAEFDAHRADFRSTLDSLEMASTETERVYEEQKRDLLAQLAELQEVSQSKEDFEGVARQLKQLEELVAELEEGLEESRRGEAEARGEVEFLRGEVERGRSELRREREKAAAAAAAKHVSVTSTGSSVKDLEQRDDEIRGLKAIIHSLSGGGANSAAVDGDDDTQIVDQDESKRLQAALDESRSEKEALEQQLEELRRERAHADSNGQVHARNASEMTEKALPSRARSNTVKATMSAVNGHNESGPRRNETDGEAFGQSRDKNHTASDGTFCEMCESPDHDTLDCTKLSQRHAESTKVQQSETTLGSDKPALDMGKENRGVANAEAEKSADADKWCALCEKDGHLAFDCPEEQY